MTEELQGFLAVVRRLLPPGAAERRGLAPADFRAALDVQDLWRWAKANPAAVREGLAP